MAQSYLDFSPLQKRPSRTGDIYAAGIQSLGQGVTKAIDKYKEVKKKNQEGMYSPMEDINAIENNALRLYYTDRWDKDIKSKYLPIFKTFRGNLDKANQIEMQSDIESFTRALEYDNMMAKSISEARQKASKSPYYQIDEESVDKFWESHKPDENGNYNFDETAKAGSSGMRSDTGSPFLNYAKINVDPVLKNTYTKSIKDLEQRGNKVVKETDVNGNVVRTTTIPYTRDPESVKASMRMAISKLPIEGVLAMENSLMKDASPEQIKKASEEYSQYKTPFLEIAIDEYPVEEERVYKETLTKPKKATSSTTSKKEFTNLLNKEGVERSNVFGVTSNNFVDYSQAQPKYRNLNNFIPPKGSEEYTSINTDDVTPDINVKSFTGSGVPSDYEIVGHDKENGTFWIIPSKKPTTEVRGKEIPIESMVVVPEDYILEYYDAKANYKKPEPKKEKSSKWDKYKRQ